MTFSIPQQTLQLILVTADAWQATGGWMQWFTRSQANAAWIVKSDRFPVMLGRNGLAWAPEFSTQGTVKTEGDGKSPAGLFSVSAIFGDAPPALMTHLKMPYLQATENLICVDDPASPFYNYLVDMTHAKTAVWRSCESMLRNDDCYRLGVVIDYNKTPIIAGAGSCIFLHLWQSPTHPTAGCTAMAMETMNQLTNWLDNQLNPYLLQLPTSELQHVAQFS